MATKPAIAYIDGHNFYHGAMKGHPALKWLDLRTRLCSRLIARKGDLQLVKYFTGEGRRHGRPDAEPTAGHLPAGVSKASRCADHRGARRHRRRECAPREHGKIAKAWVYEEKGTDVNLAAHLVADSCGDLELALVVSNDSDLQEAVNIARSQGVEVRVANPHHRNKRSTDGARNRRYRAALRGDGGLTIRRSHLESCQLPDPYQGIDRPLKWT